VIDIDRADTGCARIVIQAAIDKVAIRVAASAAHQRFTPLSTIRFGPTAPTYRIEGDAVSPMGIRKAPFRRRPKRFGADGAPRTPSRLKGPGFQTGADTARKLSPKRVE